MSADNCLMILRTPKYSDVGYEYRVAEMGSDHWDYLEFARRGEVEAHAEILFRQFKKSATFPHEDFAYDAAQAALDGAEKRGDYIEYGICEIHCEVSFF